MFLPHTSVASHHCSQWLAKVISIQGEAHAQYPGDNAWHTLSPDIEFCHGDKVRTKKHSRVTLLFSNQSRATLDQSSTLILMAPEQKKSSWYIDLIKGTSFFRSRQPHRLDIRTPFINAVHEGTEFTVSVEADHTEITVLDGLVAADNAQGKIKIKKGYTGIAQLNQPPKLKPLKIFPQDAVQWTLYYPPIIDIQSFKTGNTALKPVIEAYTHGNSYQSLQLLDKTPITQRDISYHILKAGLLLTTGSVAAANEQIELILQSQQNNSSALALKSIIAVTKNRTDKALKLAHAAISSDPQAAIAQIAISYAYQSKFKIDRAIEATEQAIKLSPSNTLAWVRLSELQLSTGERNDALSSAEKAQKLNPQLDRIQTILGFNHLAQVNIDQAKIAFIQAIKLNSGDPLAFLGLGLAKIRKGNVKEGTHDIETAVSLDPDSSIIRSYLGKAYYELNKNEFASTEFALAKEMDPNDPTPWFYGAIHKQTTNRPVEALHDMQQAIKLNDNRGVYRSKLLLDEDAAARSANMARIYQDLNFDRLALKQAWTSLAQDYTNHSAHRFLSDNLQGKPRQRIARASELLQAQLFQPINTVPVQPQLTNENIGILNTTGPGSLSSNEYDSLFTSNGAHILLNGAIGSNNTLTDSAIISSVYDNVSLSFGQFHFQTDGFRKNDDYEQNVYNAFAQIAITPDLNLQLEFKSEDVRAGDVPLRFNNFHQENFRQSQEKDSARFGLNYKIDNNQAVIVSAFLTDFEDSNFDSNSSFSITALPFPFSRIETTEIKTENINFDESGYQIEGQYLLNFNSVNFISGVGYLNVDATRSRISKTDTTDNLFSFFPGMPITAEGSAINSSQNNLETNYFNGYIYSRYQITPNFTSIIGLSYDNYDDSVMSINQLNPKIGVNWKPTEDLLIRGAVFRNLKRPLASNQTIEPTEISGFNQLFDENDGASSWNYGASIDYKISKNLYIGSEAFWRETKQPEITANNIVQFHDRNEASYLSYLYWSPLKWLSFSSQYRFNEFRKKINNISEDNQNAKNTETHEVLFNINMYHSSGIFSRLSAINLNQSTEFESTAQSLNKESDDFWLFNTSIGLRLPNKLGSINFEVLNMFNNKGFQYHSEWNSSGPVLSKFTPEREFFIKLNLAY